MRVTVNHDHVLEIPPDLFAVVGVCFAIDGEKRFFLDLHLPVKEHNRAKEQQQQYPVRNGEEHTRENQDERKVDRVAGHRENAARDQLAGVRFVQPDAEAPAERCERGNKQRKPQHAERAACDGERGGGEHLAAGHEPAEQARQHDVKVQEDERQDEKVLFVVLADLHGVDAETAQPQAAGDYQQNYAKEYACGEIAHGFLLFSDDAVEYWE